MFPYESAILRLTCRSMGRWSFHPHMGYTISSPPSPRPTCCRLFVFTTNTATPSWNVLTPLSIDENGNLGAIPRTKTGTSGWGGQLEAGLVSSKSRERNRQEMYKKMQSRGPAFSISLWAKRWSQSPLRVARTTCGFNGAAEISGDPQPATIYW